MKDIFIIYWSSTGNTRRMAEEVGAGVAKAGGNPKVLEVAKADVSILKEADAFALGASAMGAEELDMEMDAFTSQVEVFASGKTIALFGSYDWGDGEWMREWVGRMERAGAAVIGGEEAITQLEPDKAAIEMCVSLGAALVK